MFDMYRENKSIYECRSYRKKRTTGEYLIYNFPLKYWQYSFCRKNIYVIFALYNEKHKKAVNF